MYVLILGGGRTGTQLAKLLLDQAHEVLVIENRLDVLSRIHKELPTEVIFQGFPTDPNVLEQARISEANVVAACTVNDTDNLVICYLARALFNVPRTIARVNNPRNAWLFNESFHVDVALNNAEIMARLIEEEMSLGDMMTLVKLRRGDYSLVEEKIPAGANALGMAIKDIDFPDNCVIAAIIRDGKIVVPRGITTFEVGDEVLAVADKQGAQRISELFSSPSEPSQRNHV